MRGNHSDDLINTHELGWAATAKFFVYSYTASNNAGRLAEKVYPFFSLNIDKLSTISLNYRSESSEFHKT